MVAGNKRTMRGHAIGMASMTSVNFWAGLVLPEMRIKKEERNGLGMGSPYRIVNGPSVFD